MRGLPRPAFHRRIGRFEVEVDGWDHRRRASFEPDRRCDHLELTARGWLVVRRTWWAVTGGPGSGFAQLAQPSSWAAAPPEHRPLGLVGDAGG
jgi:hypothetical protein